LSLRIYGGRHGQAAGKVVAVGGYMYLWFGSVCVLMMESACSPLLRARLYELQPLYSNRAGNGIGFSKGEMEVGKGMEADRAWAMAKTALE
jgi:hypothetical protein